MNADEFDAFYAAAFGRLAAQVFAMCGDRQEAQDCVQEAFIRAWERRGAFTASSSPDAWIRTVAYRLAVSSWRRRRRHLPWDSTDVPTPELSPNRVAIQRALAELPAQQRRAVVLFYLADLSVDEIADELGAPRGTVTSWLARGRARLAPLLSDRVEARHV